MFSLNEEEKRWQRCLLENMEKYCLEINLPLY
jgi:hypothetical protein